MRPFWTNFRGTPLTWTSQNSASEELKVLVSQNLFLRQALKSLIWSKNCLFTMLIIESQLLKQLNTRGLKRLESKKTCLSNSTRWHSSRQVCALQTFPTHCLSIVNTLMSWPPSVTLPKSSRKYRRFTPRRSSQWRHRRNCQTCKWDTIRKVPCLQKEETTLATPLTATIKTRISNNCHWSRAEEAIWTWWTITSSTWTTPSTTTRPRSPRRPTPWKLKTSSSVERKRTHQHSTRASIWRTRPRPLRHSSKVSLTKLF